MSDEDNFLDDTVESVFDKLVKEGKFISFDKNGNVIEGKSFNSPFFNNSYIASFESSINGEDTE